MAPARPCRAQGGRIQPPSAERKLLSAVARSTRPRTGEAGCPARHAPDSVDVRQAGPAHRTAMGSASEERPVDWLSPRFHAPVANSAKQACFSARPVRIGHPAYAFRKARDEIGRGPRGQRGLRLIAIKRDCSAPQQRNPPQRRPSKPGHRDEPRSCAPGIGAFADRVAAILCPNSFRVRLDGIAGHRKPLNALGRCFHPARKRKAPPRILRGGARAGSPQKLRGGGSIPLNRSLRRRSFP